MCYVISINQNFARTLDEQAALRLAAIDDVCEFVRLCHFFKVHENFLWHCLGISLPQECPSFFFTSNTCDVLFCLKSCGYLRTANRVISMADQSDVNNDTFRLRSFVRPNLRRGLEDGIRKISSVNDFETRTPFSCLVTLRFHHFHVFILCLDV